MADKLKEHIEHLSSEENKKLETGLKAWVQLKANIPVKQGKNSVKACAGLKKLIINSEITAKGVEYYAYGSERLGIALSRHMAGETCIKCCDVKLHRN